MGGEAGLTTGAIGLTTIRHSKVREPLGEDLAMTVQR